MRRGTSPSFWKRYEASQFSLASSSVTNMPVGPRVKQVKIPQMSNISTAANSLRVVAVNPAK
jgi:hypothetical protein